MASSTVQVNNDFTTTSIPLSSSVTSPPPGGSKLSHMETDEEFEDYQLVNIDYETGYITETPILHKGTQQWGGMENEFESQVEHDMSAQSFLDILDFYENLPSLHKLDHAAVPVIAADTKPIVDCLKTALTTHRTKLALIVGKQDAVWAGKTTHNDKETTNNSISERLQAKRHSGHPTYDQHHTHSSSTHGISSLGACKEAMLSMDQMLLDLSKHQETIRQRGSRQDLIEPNSRITTSNCTPGSALPRTRSSESEKAIFMQQIKLLREINITNSQRRGTAACIDIDFQGEFHPARATMGDLE
jgi:hypothetical protein